jgi:hypothetical protein
MWLRTFIKEFLKALQELFHWGADDGDVEDVPGSVRWVSIQVPPEKSVNHFMAVGTTGSGKTTILRLLMQDALPQVGTGDCRALVYDAKQDMVAILSGIVPMERVVIMNPFDSRCVRWDMAVDLDEPRTILEAVTILFPKVPDSTQFFHDACVSITYHVLLSWHLSGFQYQFADLLRVLKRYDYMVQVLRQHDQTQHIIKQYFADKKLRHNILASLAVRVLPYDHIAACWERATDSFSIKEWSEGEYILVLGNAEVSRYSVDAINRFLFKLCVNYTLNKPESSTSQSWFLLDEVTEMGKLDGLVSLLKKGRSKGARVVLACQTISGLRDANMYGQSGADEILGQIGHKFVGRLECVATADYFSQLIGEHEIWIASSSYTSSSQNSSSTTSYNRQVKKAILPSTLLSIDPCSIETGLAGFCFTPDIGVFKVRLDGRQLFLRDLLRIGKEPALIARTADEQILGPWTAARLIDFALKLITRKNRPLLEAPKADEQPRITKDDPLF